MILLDPKITSAWFNRANAYKFLERYEEAISDYSVAISLSPEYAGALRGRANCFAAMHKKDSAIKDFSEALRINPDDSLSLNSRGELYYEQKKYDEAIADFTAALRVAPQYMAAWHNRGNAYFYLGKYDAAISDYTKAALIYPNNTAALDNRGNAYKIQQKYDLAIADYNEVIRINPSYKEAWNSLGNTYNAQGKYEAAITRYLKAIAIDPKYVYAWYNAGKAYIYLGKYDSAVYYLNEAVRLDPKYLEAIFFRGYSYFYLAKYDLAVMDYNSVLNMDSLYTDAWNNIGLVYYRQEKNDLAIYYFSQALKINPKYTEGWNNRGLTYYNMGKFDSAISDFGKALEVNPKFANGWNNHGLIYYKQANYALAISDYKQALGLEPNNSLFIINLVMAYLATDDYEKAAAQYRIYQHKNLSSYIEGNKSYSFLKKYISACIDFIAVKDYVHALPLLQASLEEYKQANQDQQSNAALSLEYSNVLAKTGFVYEESGQKDKALEYYQKTNAIRPGQELIMQRIEKLQNKINDDKLTDNSTPEIQLLSPAIVQGTMVQFDPSGKLFVSGIVKSVSGIDWVKVNGGDVPAQANGYFSVNLAENKSFTIQASNKKGLITSVNYQLQTRSAAQEGDDGIPAIPAEEAPVFHAVLIACSNYSGDKWKKLPSTIPEAKAYEEVLTNYYGFDKKNVRELFDKNGEDILEQLSAELESLHENDNLIIMFAGHGTFTGDGENMIGYWVPLNASKPVDYISNGRLAELIKGCRARHILLISDACYSAAMRGDDDYSHALPKKYEYNHKSRQVLTSGGLEKVPGESIFINMAMKALKENDQKYLSVQELHNLIYNGVKNQTNILPDLKPFGSNGNEGGQFYFIRSK